MLALSALKIGNTGGVWGSDKLPFSVNFLVQEETFTKKPKLWNSHVLIYLAHNSEIPIGNMIRYDDIVQIIMTNTQWSLSVQRLFNYNLT